MNTKLFITTSTVADGNMDFRFGPKEVVLQNRKRFLQTFELTPEDCVFMELEHGDVITRVESGTLPKPLDGNVILTEALLTTSPKSVLFLMTADCLPVVFSDSVQKAIGLAHLARKSTSKKLAAKVVRQMQEQFGSEPKDIAVYFGPAIQKKSYRLESPPEDLTQEWGDFTEELSSGEVAIDVAGYNKFQLEQAGVLPENITNESIDTVQSEEYFSHYRSVRSGEPEGRFATLVWLAEVQ